MLVTRHAVFETNSSSTHSICLGQGEVVKDTLPMDGDQVFIYPGEFGWEEYTYRDARTKASYALTWATSAEGYGVGKTEAWLQMLREVILEETGAASVDFRKLSDDFKPLGYIDHQSIEGDGGPGGEAFASKESLANFIFNSDSILRTDNDNHD